MEEDSGAIVSEEIEGVVEKIVYANEENGYAVVRIERNGEVIAAAGTIIRPATGHHLRLKGEWTTHPRYGRQFRADESRWIAPVTANGIESYLASGVIPGIGPGLAKSIVEKFGVRSLDILDADPEQLCLIRGIGSKRLTLIRNAREDEKDSREAMIFLQSQGVGAGVAARVYKHYGAQTVQSVEHDPYRLAREVPGIGFLTADQIAVNLGLPRDSIRRAEAGVLHTLEESSAKGDVYLPALRLIQDAQITLQIDREIVIRALDALIEHRALISEASDDSSVRPVYLPSLYRAETGVAALLGELLTPRAGVSGAFERIDPDAAIKQVRRRMDIRLAPKQEEAIRNVLTYRVTVITGGPGTGKTTIVRSLLAILDAAARTTILAAPTGRAAKRIKESSGHDAATIHRLLEFSPVERRFRRDERNPLECDVVILDEVSMVDVMLMYRLLRALPPGVTLVLVGDADQLPSVGPGRVLADLILSRAVPVTELDEVFRQAEASRIVVNAHRINVGLPPLSEPDGDFFLIEQEDPNRILDLILELCRERIPRRFDLDSIDDIQVLSPMHRGEVGVTNLNRRLQMALNPEGTGIQIGERLFKPGDKVMQTRNNYEKNVYNGDIGRLDMVDPQGQSLIVRFDDGTVRYQRREIDELSLAYAISVHKSQGSEFPAVIVPVVTQHYMLLQRNLIYTAVSRGRKLVVVLGSRSAIRMAVRNTDTGDRFSMLKQRLSEYQNMI